MGPHPTPTGRAFGGEGSSLERSNPGSLERLSSHALESWYSRECMPKSSPLESSYSLEALVEGAAVTAAVTAAGYVAVSPAGTARGREGIASRSSATVNVRTQEAIEV